MHLKKNKKKEKNWQFESDIEVLLKSADEFAERAEASGNTTWIANLTA